MRKINILVTGDIPGGLDPFQHDGIECRFHQYDATGRTPFIEGAIWAFLDWESPRTDAIEACRQIRCAPETSSARIVMVLREKDDSVYRRALLAGADDYMIGPADRNKLLDRILMRLPDQQDLTLSNLTVLGDLRIDLAAFRATWSGKPIPLTPTELKLLRFFARNPDRVFTRTQLIAALGKQEPPIDERTVDVWIGRVRKGLRKVGAGSRLRTVRALGYVFDGT